MNITMGPVTFTPRRASAAPLPRHRPKRRIRCGGVRVRRACELHIVAGGCGSQPLRCAGAGHCLDRQRPGQAASVVALYLRPAQFVILAALFNTVFCWCGGASPGKRSCDCSSRTGSQRHGNDRCHPGIVINGATAWLFASGRGHLKIRGAFMHMIADAAVSAGVVVAGLACSTPLGLVDPLTGLVIVGVIVWGTWCLLRIPCESVNGARRSLPKRFDDTLRLSDVRPSMTSYLGDEHDESADRPPCVSRRPSR